jgi:hypothetical protein
VEFGGGCRGLPARRGHEQQLLDRRRGGATLLSENFAGFTVLAGSVDRSGSLNTYLQTPGWTGAAVYENAGEAKMGSSSARGILVSPTLDLSANGGQAVFTFDARYFSGNDASVVQVHVAPDGVNFVQSGADIALTPDMTTYTHPITNGTAICKVRVYALNAASERYYIDNWQIAQLGGDPNFVPGYSNRTVSGTSQSVTGLAAGATYYFRVRAVNSGGTSPNTSVASVTTLATLSAPVFGANPGPIATTAGMATVFTVGASGVPAPALSLQSQTATSGYSFNEGTGELTYTPPQADAGERTFTFSAINSQGTASQTVTVNVAAATAPAFTGGAGPYSTTVGVAVAFTVTASGTPAATLALADQSASGGYSFTPATGAFTYTPPVGDVGTPTFTFTAANAAGTVTQVTSVVVSAVPTAPAAPAAIWAGATNATDFTAAWSAASGADSYRLDVATNETFSGGGGGGGSTIISENIQSWTARASYGTWTQTIPTGTVTMTRCIVAPAAVASGVGSIGRVQLEASTGILELPALNTGGSIAMNIAAGAAGRTVKLQKYNGSTWDDLTTWTGIGTTGAAFTYDVDDSGPAVRLRIATPSAAIYVHDITVTSSGGSAVPSFVPGYSNRTVSGTSESVTGLVENTTYYFRARAVNGVGTSGNSPTGVVTTLEASVPGTPPVVDAIPAQIANVGVDFEYAVTATEPDADTVTFACISAVDGATWDFDMNTGDFLFTPTAAQLGTNGFSFTATDKDGTSDPVQMSVKVYSAAASNEFAQWIEDREQDPADPEYAPDGDADFDGMSNYDEFLADTDPNDPGELLELSGQYVIASQAGEATGQIRFSFPASPNRFYQLEYCTGLTNHVIGTTNLGWGVPGMVVTSDAPATWYGVIRVFLHEP